MPLDDVESKRGEDGDEECYITATLRAKKVKELIIWLIGLIVGACNYPYPFIYRGRSGRAPKCSLTDT
jgi:hypothetical protein